MAKSFLEKFKTKISKIETLVLDHIEPRYYLDTGIKSFNRILSGSYTKGIPQGRVCAYAGPSGAGKSYLLCNTIRETINSGGLVLAMDSENALDSGYIEKIGIDVNSPNFLYVGVTLISDVTKVVSNFVSAYKDDYKDDLHNAPRVLIVLDSINMLVTDSEADNFNAGANKGDQGQHAKQMGTCLRLISQAIKALNISMVNTCQVYENPDIKNGKGKYLMTDKIKYFQTFIGLIERKTLKDAPTIGAPILGFIMKCSTYKSRMNILGAYTEVEVPWETGVNPYSGLPSLLLSDGLIVEHNKLSYTIVSTGRIVKKYELRDEMNKEVFEEIVGDFEAVDVTSDLPTEHNEVAENEETFLVENEE